MRHAQRAGNVAASQAPPFRALDRDICDAYLYLLGRLLVLRQEHLDLRSGAEWNRLLHHEPGTQLVCSEAWVVVDERSSTVIDVPKIGHRYYTIHVLNPWGETIANINERTFPDRPAGSFALCMNDADVALPDGARRIDLPGRKARVLIHVETGRDPAEAVAVQRAFTMWSTASPVVPAVVGIPLFPNDELPGAEAFDAALAVLATERDINGGVDAIQTAVRAIAELARGDERGRIDRVIRQRSWGLRQALYSSRNEWVTARVAGNYGPDWLARTAANMFELWSNTKSEVARFQAGATTPLDGSETYVLKFDKNAPTPHVHHFWSICVNGVTSSRPLLSSRSELHVGRHRALTLYFAPTLPSGAPEQNWLPTPATGRYSLDWRSFGPDDATVAGRWAPPALQKVSTLAT